MNQWIKITLYLLFVTLSPSLYADNTSSSALEYFQTKAAAQQLPLAETSLKNKEFTKALEVYKHFADQNLPLAQYQLGYMYLNGLGVEKNYESPLSYTN